MAGSRSMRLVQAAVRCYSERWRSRHGTDAAELARLLMRDGTPARSIAWSYFKGAASARLMPQPRGRLGAALGALLAAACSLGVSLALLSSSVPAGATSMVRVRITNRGDAAGQLRSLLRTQHFDISLPGYRRAARGRGTTGAPRWRPARGGARRAKLARHTSERTGQRHARPPA
jgi:hypothetical protein